MATVKMKKGDKLADIYDSEETIRQARKEGYSVVEDPKQEPGSDESGKDPKQEPGSASKGNGKK